MNLSRRLFVGCSASVALGSSLGAFAEEILPTIASATGQPSANKDAAYGAAEGDKGQGRSPLRILYNENPLGPSPLAVRAAADMAGSGNFYPFAAGIQLIGQLQRLHDLPASPDGNDSQVMRDPTFSGDHQIVLGAGSSELLLAAALAFTVEGGNVVEPAPSYESIGATASRRPGPFVERRQIPLLDDGRLDVENLLAACDQKTRILVVTNPNNPTGGALSDAALRRLVTDAPAHVLVFVDEAYIDFLEDSASRTAVPLAKQMDNVLVVRTFSKLFGMAGLRVGYALGHKRIFDRMRHFQVGSLSLNATGLAAASESLRDEDFQARSRRMAADSRTEITKELQRLGFRVSACDAACLWADWGRPVKPLVSALAERGILICSGERWKVPTAVRISVATGEQTSRLLNDINDLVSRV